MESTMAKSCVAVIILSLLCAGILEAQNASTIWLHLTTNVSYPTLYRDQSFGNHVDATFGIDYQLGEFECPPDAPGFEFYWIGIPGRHVNYWGNCGKDYRPYISPAQSDVP